ncbi:AraC family transcriptional regulator [Anaerocolumna sp. AGMB13025]|uniref:AraC family transcriptional regulator n=1 Tax=Anaerocolumna sp. AGMB13025 TaxID=3039116 RepID=UPI00241C529D|nr:AraC family transcriptional regulator [Anaerocolumna sp. AGMB13025]WFR60065.1 AraC family transcriptional regulator [Anaerocolumna sp. AGMB13025]
MIEKLTGTRETVYHPDNMPVRLYINREYEDYPIHWHMDVELIMPLEGMYTVVVDKEQYILNPGDIIMIPSGEMHELFAPPSGKRLIVQCDNSLLNGLVGIDSISGGFYPCILSRQTDKAEYHQHLVSMLKQVADEYINRPPFYMISIEALLKNFFVIAGRNCLNLDKLDKSVVKNKQHQYIDKFLHICQYINEHCTENLTIDEVATMAGFSKYHFFRLFCKFSGVTYYEYLVKRRIMYAERLLTDPNLSIVQIAMRSGFNSLSAFNRNFREIKKCTPTEYRNMYNSSCIQQITVKNAVGK